MGEIFHTIYQISVVSLLGILCLLFLLMNNKLKSVKKETVHVFDLPKTLDLEKKSENVLSELRALIDADRITLLRFHNGLEFLPNNPVWKLTGTSTVRADGVSDETVNDLMVLRVQPLINPLITGEAEDDSVKKPPFCEKCPRGRMCEETNNRIMGFEVDKMRGYSKSFLQKRGTEFAYVASLTNVDKNIFGVLLVEYCEQPTGVEKNNRIIQTICGFTIKLCFLFN